jgi:hypothetical protein
LGEVMVIDRDGKILFRANLPANEPIQMRDHRRRRRKQSRGRGHEESVRLESNKVDKLAYSFHRESVHTKLIHA